MTTAIIVKPEAVRERIKENREWFRSVGKEGQKRWMRLSSDLQTVRDGMMWKGWKDPKGRKFTNFDDYLEIEVGISKSKGYMMLQVVDHLKLSPAKLEELGKTKCYELARVAQERPKEFKKLLARVEKNPDMTVSEVRSAVDAALDGHGLEHFERLEFVVKRGDVQTIAEALAVIQAQEPVENPDSPSGRGVHLVSLAQEFLSGEEQIVILKDLKKNGYFRRNGVPFELEN